MDGAAMRAAHADFSRPIALYGFGVPRHFHMHRLPRMRAFELKQHGSPRFLVSLSDLGSDTALSRNLDGQVLDAGLLNWLGVEFHQRHYLLRHTHFDRQAQRAGFTGSQRVIMRPMAARKFFREGFSGPLLHPPPQ